MSAGDFVAPSLLSSIDHGRGMVDVLNQVGVGVVCFGNHESDVQHESLAVRNGATLTLFRDLALRIVLEQGEHELPPGFSAALALRGLDGLLKPLAPFRPFTGLGEVLLHSDQLDAVELWWGRHHSQDPLLGYERIPGTGSVPLELQLVPGVQRFVLAPPSFEPSLGQAVTDD